VTREEIIAANPTVTFGPDRIVFGMHVMKATQADGTESVYCWLLKGNAHVSLPSPAPRGSYAHAKTSLVWDKNGRPFPSVRRYA
jgi:hypothetical protein